MIRAGAAARIVQIVRGDVPLQRTTHARQRMFERKFTMHDIVAILRSNLMESAPEWDSKRLNYRVSLLGTCTAGRQSRIIVGLRPAGPCVLITVMRLGTQAWFMGSTE